MDDKYHLQLKKQDIISLICAIVISVSMNLYPDDIAVDVVLILRIAIGIGLHFFLLRFGFGFLDRFSKVDGKARSLGKKNVFACFVILSIVFLAPLIIYYPGVNGWDTEYQLVDLFDGTQMMHKEAWGDYYVPYTLSDHMNLFVTLLFGAFVKFGMLLGDATIGVFIYCILQALFFAYVCTYLLIKLSEWGVNRKFVTIAFLFYALLPFIWMYSINMIKDSVNAAIFVLYFLLFIGIIRGEQEIGARLFVLSLLVCLTKKTGIIIVIPSNLALAFLKWKEKHFKFKDLIISISPFLIIGVLLHRIIYPMLNVYQDGLQETIAFMFQQIARTAKYAPNSFTTQDAEIINRVIDFEKLPVIYDYHLVDSVKDTFRPTASIIEIANFIGLWVKNAFHHPLIYVRSLIGTNGGFFSPTHRINIYTIFNDWGNLGISYHPWASNARVAFYEIYEHISMFPLINILFQTYLYSWVIVCFSMWRAIREKSKRLVMAFVPAYVSVITFVLSPDVNSRYALHIIMIAPVIVCLCSSIVREKQNATQCTDEQKELCLDEEVDYA